MIIFKILKKNYLLEGQMDNIISTKNEERLVGGDGPDNASEK